jgi:parallel beta-helix repeat protein
MLGPTMGSVVRGNRIEDVHSFDQAGATAWGIYLDEGSSDVLVERNLVRRTTGGGFHLHYGENNVVRNNIFIEGKVAQAARDRKDKSLLKFELNVLVPGRAPVFSGEWSDPAVFNRANLVVRNDGNISSGQPANASPENFESGAAVGDLGLECSKVDCKVLSRRLLDAGFTNFSVDKAGIQERGAVLGGR